MNLPVKPPIQPQLARSAKDLPAGEGWRFEPKYDGFRTLTYSRPCVPFTLGNLARVRECMLQLANSFFCAHIAR